MRRKLKQQKTKRSPAPVCASGLLLRCEQYGGRGRIRTSVARKERQIYSLLVLATHPPVRTGESLRRRPLCSSKKKRHNSASFAMQKPASRKKRESSPDSKIFLAELAEGFEPP